MTLIPSLFGTATSLRERVDYRTVYTHTHTKLYHSYYICVFIFIYIYRRS